MSGVKPCLGYPTRTAAVHALRGEGLSTRAIAREIGIPEKNVIALECSGSRPKRMPRPSEALGRTVVLPVDVLNSLGPHAARRNISPNHLVRLLISTIVDEGLVDSVMDDADDLDWSRT